ncbi:MAG: hypothetical protein VX910_04640 [Candidatus Latescibacterota bacterium]|nr:hypothetical protein [Candidatus Latescibacterota bacterium]
MPEQPFADLIASLIPNLLPNNPRITAEVSVVAPGGLHANIRRVRLLSGKTVIAKRHTFAFSTAKQHYDLLTVEQAVTGILRTAGCSVPDVLAVDHNTGIVILEDVGVTTLDDSVQTFPPTERFKLARSAIDAFLRIQHTFVNQKSLKRDLVAPGGDRKSVKDAFEGLTELLGPEQLRPLVSGSATDSDLGNVATLVHRLSEKTLILGPTDYNARNIVLADNAKAWFLEWSKIGFDWPERRAVQYLTSLGAGRPGSRPRSLIDRWIANRYAVSATWTDRVDAASDLDAHHLIFHILLALRWTASGADLPRIIRKSLITPLSEDLETGNLRSLFCRSKSK